MHILYDIVINFASRKVQSKIRRYEGPFLETKGGEITNESVPSGPFEPQIPYVLSLFNEAANLYNQGPPQAFTGLDGNLTAGINPNIANTYSNVGGITGSQIDQNQMIQQMLMQQALAGTPLQNISSSVSGGIPGGIAAQLNALSNPLTNFASGLSGDAANAYQTALNSGPFQAGTQAGNTDISEALGQQLAGGGGTNPYLDELVNAAVRSQINSFETDVLPSIRQEAQAAGQIGGTRQGIAEGIATRGLNDNIADTTARIYGGAFDTQAQLQNQTVANLIGAQQSDQAVEASAYDQYLQRLLQGAGQVQGGLGQGLGLGYNAVGTGTAQASNLLNSADSMALQRMLSSYGMIPQFSTDTLTNLSSQNQLGLQQYGLDQNVIDALREQYYYNVNAPFNLLSQYQQFITGPYGSTVGDYQAPAQNYPVGPPAQPITPPGTQTPVQNVNQNPRTSPQNVPFQ